MQNNNESMGELSEILKNLVQEPITNIYQDSISEDVKKIQRKLNDISSIDKKISALKTNLDERFDELEDQVGNVLKLNDALVSKVNDISPKLVLIGTELQDGFDKASKQVGDAKTQNDRLTDKLDTVFDVCGQVLEKSVETENNFVGIFKGSNQSLDVLSSLSESVDQNYSRLDERIDTQNKEVIELLAGIGVINNNTNETKALVDQLLQSNEMLRESLKESAARDQLLKKSIRNNRWVIVISILLVSSIIVAFEMNLLPNI